jgi:phospholipid/cholesterol/gamma-HCH transport system substrate-binding protein
MPQRKQASWRQLRVGLFVVISLIVLAVGIFFISGQISFLTRHYTLKTYFPSAGDLRTGALVRLAGITVGNVNRIAISPLSDPDRAVEIDMRISGDFQKQIRGDSVATLETVGLLGETYVDITRGTPPHEVLKNEGVVQGQTEPGMKEVVENANDVISNLRVLSAKLTDITSQIQNGRGSIGQLIYQDAFYRHLDKTVTDAQKLIDQVNEGHGSLGKLVSDETLYNKTVAAVDHLNQIIDEIQNGNGTMTKLIKDPELYNRLNQVASNANTLINNINGGKGTLGKLATDPSLYNNLNEATQKVNVITSRIEQGQGTLGKLSTDPSLFNSLNSSAQSLRDFLTEFQKNPRKYLTLHLHIF